MEQLRIEMEIARRQMELGVGRALDRAEREIPSWGELALDYIRRYAERHERFYGWMVVKSAANDPNFPSPLNEKAWGGPIQKAARMGLIERVGAGPDPHRHGNLVPLWGSRLCGGAHD